MPFSAVGLLVRVHPARLTAFGSLHALTIDAGRAGLRVAAGLLARLPHQRGIDRFPHTTAGPTPEKAVDRLPRWQILRQHAPLTAGPGDIHDGVDNEPHFPFAWSAALTGRKVLFKLLPFGILEIGRVGLRECGLPQAYPTFKKHSLRNET
jgi:hypothetical protein